MEEGQAKLLWKLNDDKQGVSGSTSTTELCDLPDSLLHHILSFLPTKFAFRTSVLSKRWHHVSESMPCLRFGERDFQNFLCVAVESALRCPDMSCSIQEFSLDCSLENCFSHINRWITAAVKRNVKVLKLSFASMSLSYQYWWPHCIFMSETLVELELSLLYDHALLIIPTSTGLSNLKILTLHGVLFVDEESTQKLLSCPTLEELSISYCCWNNDIKLLKVSAPSLLKLSIIDHSSVAGNNASMLLNGLSSVQSLTLSDSILEQISSRDELLNALPTFSKLTMLSLDCRYQAITHPRWYSWAMFERFPHLETLEYLAFHFDDTPSNPPDLVPLCFRSHLKKIVVSGFEPKEPIIISHMVQLLGISTCLEELVIRYGQKKKKIIKPEKLLKRLTLLPKASANCRISVVVRYGKNLARQKVVSC